MRLLVLGASGGVGRWLTRLAAERGHAVTALVRPRSEVDAPATVRVERGDPLDARVLESVVAGQNAVASCVGIRRKGKWPWAGMLSPADLTQRVAQVLVPVMQRAGVRRLVAVSAGGVGDGFSHLTWPVRRTVRSGNIARQYRDLEEMEKVLAASTLDWLAVRPVTLVDGAPTGRAHAIARYRLTSIIRRADVAAFMLGALEQPGDFRERHVMIGY